VTGGAKDQGKGQGGRNREARGRGVGRKWETRGKVDDAWSHLAFHHTKTALGLPPLHK
jgi:hypothetical protein